MSYNGVAWLKVLWISSLKRVYDLKETTTEIFKSLVLPALLDDCDTWIENKTEK